MLSVYLYPVYKKMIESIKLFTERAFFMKYPSENTNTNLGIVEDWQEAKKALAEGKNRISLIHYKR